MRRAFSPTPSAPSALEAVAFIEARVPKGGGRLAEGCQANIGSVKTRESEGWGKRARGISPLTNIFRPSLSVLSVVGRFVADKAGNHAFPAAAANGVTFGGDPTGVAVVPIKKDVRSRRRKC